MKKQFDIRGDEIRLKDGYWSDLLHNQLNSLIFQWNQMEKMGIIKNFQICFTKSRKETHNGLLDSDGNFYKWIETSAILLSQFSHKKNSLMTQSLIDLLNEKLDFALTLINRTQAEDGYINTYNQFHTKSKRRWQCFLLENELYNIALLIDAGIAYFNATQNQKLITCAQKAAKLIIQNIAFSKNKIPGSPLIEYSFIKLYDITENEIYLSAAKEFIEKRNKITNFHFWLFLDQYRNKIYKITSKIKTKRHIPKQKEIFAENKNCAPMKKKDFFILNSGIQKSPIPKGETFRFFHFRTAEIALINRFEKIEYPLSENLQNRKKMILAEAHQLICNHIHYHGVLGETHKKLISGFSSKDSRNPSHLFGSSLSAVAMVSYATELFNLTKDPSYIDIVEWEYYNALSASSDTSGKAFYFRQPLTLSTNENKYLNHLYSDKIEDYSQLFSTHFPSFVTNALSHVTSNIYKEEGENLYILQFLGNSTYIPRTGTWIDMYSSLPYGNEVNVRIANQNPKCFKIYIRIPAWAEGYTLYINGKKNDRPEIIMPPINDKWEPHWLNSTFLTIDMNENYDSKSIRLLFSNTIRTIEQPFIAKNRSQTPNLRFFYRNSILYYFDSSLNSHILSTHFYIDLNKTINTISLKELYKDSNIPHRLDKKIICLVATTTTGHEIILLPWGVQANFASSYKQISLPTKGGIGNWD